MVRYKAWLAVLICFAAAVSGVKAQGTDTGYVLSAPQYDINFSRQWSLVFQPSFIGKNNGLEGLAYVAVSSGASLPDPDSQAVFYAAVLGGHITPGNAKDTTIGKYSVHRQEFAYDSLPRLDSLIQARSGFAIKHKNGSFRVYSLISDGYVFAVAGLATFQNATPPYADIERAFKTLVLHPGAGVRFAEASGRGELWLRGGRLGGDWLLAHPLASAEAFDARGARVATARFSAGAWILPRVPDGFIVVVRGRDGSMRAIAFRP